MKERVLQFWNQYQSYAPAVFFLLGFVFDIITLGRVDHKRTLLQQSIYFLIIIVLLSLLLKDHHQPISPPKWLGWLWKRRGEILHFFFGALLSAYTIFYFKSASLVTSFSFLAFLCILLVLNELPQFHRLGLEFKFSLLTLCFISFAALIVPIFMGEIGFFPLLIATSLAMMMVTLLAWVYLRLGIEGRAIRKTVIRPALVIIVIFLSLYALKIIPPVPLSLQHIGVYHDIKRDAENNFGLHHENPWWKFWNSGDQSFAAQTGDDIIVFARIFSPTHFKDKVIFHWLHLDPKWGWKSMDRIPIEISGGRDEGFRAYSQKSNYTEGRWRVQVETTDGREIGRITLTVTTVKSSTPREFQTETF